MKFIGAHVSTSGGVQNAPLNAIAISAKAFAMFTKNQRQWSAPPYSKKEIELFKENLKSSKIKPEHVLPHDSYLINLGNADKTKRENSLKAFIDESLRAEQLGLSLLNFHPGSHLNEIKEEESLDLIVECLEKAREQTSKIVFAIENTAGQGSNLGYKFDHLKYLISKFSSKDRIGVCLDTAHLYASGYDIGGERGITKVFDDFDKVVGIEYLKGMHINDSKVPLSSKKDRHESLGKGTMGILPFKALIRDKRTDNIPLILETPDTNLWKSEVELLYSFER